MASTGHQTGKQTGKACGCRNALWKVTSEVIFPNKDAVLPIIIKKINWKEDSKMWQPHPAHTDPILQSHLTIKAISAQADGEVAHRWWEAVLHFRWNPNKWDYRFWRVRSRGLPSHFLHKPTFQSPAPLQDSRASGFYCHSLISLLHYCARQVWWPEQPWTLPKSSAGSRCQHQHSICRGTQRALLCQPGTRSSEWGHPFLLLLLLSAPAAWDWPTLPKVLPQHCTETPAAQKIKQQQVSLLL